MPRLHKFLDTDGNVLFKTATSFGRVAERVLDARGRGHRHMRIGHYAIVISAGEVIAAKIFDRHLLDEPHQDIKPGSRFWDSSRRDRQSQMATTLQFLSKRHPHYAGIIADIDRETAYYNDGGLIFKIPANATAQQVLDMLDDWALSEAEAAYEVWEILKARAAKEAR